MSVRHLLNTHCIFYSIKKQDAFETDNEIIAVTEYVPTGDLHKLFEIYKV